MPQPPNRNQSSRGPVRSSRTASPDRSAKTHGQSDVYVVDNKFAPGGTAGWHSHPGPSLILVVAGTVTNYLGDDPNCTPHTYTAGPASSIPAAGTCTCCATKPAPQRRRSRSSCFPRMLIGGSMSRWHPATAPSRGRTKGGGWANAHPPASSPQKRERPARRHASGTMWIARMPHLRAVSHTGIAGPRRIERQRCQREPKMACTTARRRARTHNWTP
jgi:hypothetical protein